MGIGQSHISTMLELFSILAQGSLSRGVLFSFPSLPHFMFVA